MIEALSPDDLLAATDGDMYVRVAVANGAVTDGAWAGDGAVVWANTHHGRPGFAGVGSPHGAATVVAALLDEIPDARRASLPRGWLDHLPTDLRVESRSDWDWMWTTTPPPSLPGAAGARWLVPDDHDDVSALLHEVSPGASTWPDDGRSHRWAGIRDDDGVLVACLADTSRSATVAHVSSVATAAAHRRRGHARALMGWVTRRFLEEGRSPVTLGMYADNDAARGMYGSLGFTCQHTFTGAVVAAATHPDDPTLTREGHPHRALTR
ncbi:MAG: GNAT family N-acetyltransferase [Streptosporangiales bacterium]|nr:GNAT family N-acetyltransferase [Streptosporangiales bacterium]